MSPSYAPLPGPRYAPEDAQRELDAESEHRALASFQNRYAGPARDALLREFVEKEKQRKEVEAKKKRLAEIGACPMGYAWIKQQGGYCCAGGSHFMSDGDLDKFM